MLPIPLTQFDPTTFAAVASSTGSGTDLIVPKQAAPNVTSASGNDHLSLWWLSTSTAIYITYGSGAATSSSATLEPGTYGPMIIPGGTKIQVLAITAGGVVSVIRARLV